jgi:hypothetical protein
VSVVSFQQKPKPAGGVIHAARYDGTRESVDAISEVARKSGKEAVAVAVPEMDVVVVRYLEVPDHHPSSLEYTVVERGKWLAFSEDSYSVYSTDDLDLKHWYQQVSP